MKKSLKKRIRSWKVGDYIRQFSIVTGGVLLTLWLSAKITESARQREVRQAMQLVTLELRSNLQILRTYEQLYHEEARIARLLVERNYSTASLPADTVAYYYQTINSGLNRPYNFSTDALEMLKTSGLSSHVRDKRLLIDLMRCYKTIESFDSTLTLYYELRRNELLAYHKKYPQVSSLQTREATVRSFDRMLADRSIQNWICTIPRSYNTTFFQDNVQEIIRMIESQEEYYR